MTAADAGYLVGLIGDGIGASLSPALHEQEAASQGLRYFYKLLDLAGTPDAAGKLAKVIEAMEALGFAGCNVTFPYKQRVIEYLDDLSEEARALGAVNTVLFKDGKRLGHNTDWYGFSEGLRQGLPDIALGRVALLGAGGAGSAVAYALLRLGVERLVVCDLDQSKAAGLAERLGLHLPAVQLETVEDVEALLEDADGLVQATQTGMTGHPGQPVPERSLNARLWVADVIYTPLETELVGLAKSLGCRTLGGGAMAVYQAAKAFELFTGRVADSGRMLAHFGSLHTG